MSKIKVKNFDKSEAKYLRASTIKKMQEYIKKHPNCSVLDMIHKSKITTLEFIYDNVVCTQCGHIEQKSAYAVAQRSMGHAITFNCDCGNEIDC